MAVDFRLCHVFHPEEREGLEENAVFVWHVRMWYRDPVWPRARKNRPREIDRMLDVAVLDVLPDVIDNHRSTIVFGLSRRGPEMRQADRMWMLLEFRCRKVGNVDCNGLVVQRFEQRRLIDDAVARKVQ